MKLLLMADNKVGAEITSWLLANHKQDIAAIFTASDNEILQQAKQNKIPCAVFEDSEKTCQFLDKNNIKPDLGILAWWPKIIKEPLISKPAKGIINTHPSLLPNNRGKHYNFWALVEQCPFGVTLHMVESGIDCGAIVAQTPIEYSWEDSGQTLHAKALSAMTELFIKTYPSLRTLNFAATPQDTSKGSFHLAKEIDEASRIDLEKTYKAKDLLNLLRARSFGGYPACWFTEGGQKYEVRVEIKKADQ